MTDQILCMYYAYLPAVSDSGNFVSVMQSALFASVPYVL